MSKGYTFITSIAILLSSCSSLPYTKFVIDNDKLYVGSFEKIEIQEKEYGVDNHLRILFSDKISYEINLNSSKLVDIDGHKYFDVGSIISNYSEYKNIESFFNDKNKLKVCFIYGDEGEFFSLTTGIVEIDKAGLYYFGTVSKNGEIPSYSYAQIYHQIIN